MSRGFLCGFLVAMSLGASVQSARLFERQDGIPAVVEAVNSEGVRVVVPERPEYLGGLVWVWSEEPDQPYFGLTSPYLAPAEPHRFRREIALSSPLPEGAHFVIAAAGETTVRVNGQVAAKELAANQVHVIDVRSFLRSGRNELLLDVHRAGAERIPAGLIGRLVLTEADGTKEIFPVDTSWTVERDGKGGRPVVIVGPYGIERWGQISGPLLAPPDFPRFVSPVEQRAFDLLREMTLRYYRYGSVPTYKDIWMPESYLWIGLAGAGGYDRNEALWRTAFRNRDIDEEGYVSTHQHLGLGHPRGWPFPYWMQAEGAGWAFSYRGFAYLEHQAVHNDYQNSDPAEWKFEHAEVTGQSDPEGVELRLTAPGATMTSPAIEINHRVSPFFSMEWVADDLDGRAAPWLEWTTTDEPEFSTERRVPFTFDPARKGRQRGLATLYTHPEYDGPITGFRIGFGNERQGEVSVKIFFTTQDTRHNGNNAQFIAGVYHFVAYTGDTDFLREQMPRLRTALRYAFEEFQIPELRHVRNPWVGHEGYAGVEFIHGEKVVHFDRGMGNNFWDLLPFGGNDFYSTMLYHEAILRMAEMEEQLRVLGGKPDDDAFDPAALRQLAAEIKAHANDNFWNEETDRFPAAVDFDGAKWDYGFTFVNLEAIYYDFASETHARTIMEWIHGDRIVETDTAQGEDIYRWRFAPRATTKRNWDYYKFAAHRSPERFPFGDQIQDGGAVLGFSFHDLMARHRVLGPDNAWQRLKEILTWYGEVWDAGGFLPYYETREGTLQSPQPGGLGLHREFTEPSLMPLYILQGFFGFDAKLDGFALDPHFPSELETFSVDRIRYQNALLSLHRKDDAVEVRVDAGSADGLHLHLPAGQWQIEHVGPTGVLATVETAGGTVPLVQSDSNRLIVRGCSARVAAMEAR